MGASTDIILSIEQQQLISSDVANHFSVVPVSQEANQLELKIDKAQDLSSIQEELELLLGLDVVLIQEESSVIRKCLSQYYRKTRTNEVTNVKSDFLEDLIFNTKSLGGSDIHFEIFENKGRIRIRIDGHLIERYAIELDDYLELVNKVKVKSNLDITEKRLPQDGRIEYDDFDIRVSILPTLYGEKIVMRLLRSDASNIEIASLGLDTEQEQVYKEGIKNSSGLILISGPTGSGKTTTLYATLKLLNDIKRNIVTVEDPIEYTLKGVNQVQLKESIGLSFASALKSFLRQDPDIIMLGEIRDSETAEMAVRASLTGHLVLSTIHTNSAIGTISRLVDMGVAPFLIAETLKLSVAQRLLRKLCPSCKQEEQFDAQNYILPKNFNEPIATHYVPVGCDECHFTGYTGRKAIYEIIPIDAEMISMIKENNFEGYAHKHASLSQKAFEVFKVGVTSFEEVYPYLINM